MFFIIGVKIYRFSLNNVKKKGKFKLTMEQ